MQIIREIPLPDSQRQLREFLGLINFSVPTLNTLLKHTKRPSDPLVWMDAATTAFSDIKRALADASPLVHPMPNAPTCIMTDASDIAVGAVCTKEMVHFSPRR